MSAKYIKINEFLEFPYIPGINKLEYINEKINDIFEIFTVTPHKELRGSYAVIYNKESKKYFDTGITQREIEKEFPIKHFFELHKKIYIDNAGRVILRFTTDKDQRYTMEFWSDMFIYEIAKLV